MKDEILAMIDDPKNTLESVKLPRSANKAQYNLTTQDGEVYTLTMLKSTREYSVSTKNNEIDMSAQDKGEIVNHARNVYITRANAQMLHDRSKSSRPLSEAMLYLRNNNAKK